MEREDRNVEELEERAEKVERELQDTKRDWEAKQESGSVPGVEPGDIEEESGE